MLLVVLNVLKPDTDPTFVVKQYRGFALAPSTFGTSSSEPDKLSAPARSFLDLLDPFITGVNHFNPIAPDFSWLQKRPNPITNPTIVMSYTHRQKPSGATGPSVCRNPRLPDHVALEGQWHQGRPKVRLTGIGRKSDVRCWRQTRTSRFVRELQNRLCLFAVSEPLTADAWGAF